MRDAAPKAIRLQDYRPPAFLIDTTDLVIELEEEATRVTSTLAVRRNPDPAAPQATDLELDGGNLPLLEIRLDNRDLTPDEYLLTPQSLEVKQVPDSFSLTTVTEIKPQENTTLEGLYQSSAMFCTQCEAEGFRNITFYLDRPDVMSEFTTKIVADRSRYPILLSNGNPVADGVLDNGKHWQQWHDPFKKPCYLFAMVAGDLSVVEDIFTTCSGREVAIRIFVEEKDLDKCDHALQSLKNAMKWDEDVYGREYDLDIFMVVAVDDFNMGAMENKGLNIFNTSCVLAKPDVTTDAAFQRVEGVVAHEYFHNWSGNRVTCRDWFQLSLKEGFTVFRDSQFSSDMGSPTVKRVEDVSMLRTMQFAEDSGPMAHPVQPASYMEISNFYTLTIYEKGAEVVRMIHNLLSPADFRKGSDLYFKKYDGQAVTINEFTSAMEEASGRDLTQFKRWYTQAGTPVLTISDDYDPATQCYRLTVRQECPPTPEQPEKLPQHIPLAMGLVGEERELPFTDPANGDNKVRHCVLEITEAEQSFTFEGIPERPVPSLLRDFSAPVRLRYDYSREDLLRLIRLDSDGFARWDAAQALATNIIHEVMEGYPDCDSVPVDPRFAGALQALLEDTSLDPAMVALMLQLPTEAYLSEIAETVAVDAIHSARRRVRRELATQLQPVLESTYHRLMSDEPYEPSAPQIARRSLKNTVLGYLALLPEDTHLERCQAQYRAADNMTDTLAALAAILNSDHPGAGDAGDTCLSDFYQRYEHEPLAVDQWLTLQATRQKPDALETVKALMEHPCFELTNPNKVRALIGAFCGRNLVNFHRDDGAGYRFLGEQIAALDKLNPQIAARLVNPLTRWRKYDEDRQALMVAELRRLQSIPDLSTDAYEIVSKSLVAAD